MPEKCIICGRSAERFISSDKHPQKKICVDCFNDLVLNIKTLEQELEPLAEALAKKLDSLAKEWGA